MDVLTNKKLISRNNTSQCNYVSTKIIHGVCLSKIYQSKKQKPAHNTTSQQQKLWNKKKIVLCLYWWIGTHFLQTENNFGNILAHLPILKVLFMIKRHMIFDWSLNRVNPFPDRVIDGDSGWKTTKKANNNFSRGNSFHSSLTKESKNQRLGFYIFLWIFDHIVKKQNQRSFLRHEFRTIDYGT